MRGRSEAFVVSVSSASSVGEHRDQPLEVAADQRLAAGQPELVDAEPDGRARDPGDLVEVEQLLAVEEPVVVAEDLLRHAVGATEVAPIGDRDPQVPQRPAEGVEDLRHL